MRDLTRRFLAREDQQKHLDKLCNLLKHLAKQRAKWVEQERGK